MSDFSNGPGNTELEKGTNGDGGVDHYHAHGSNCEDMGHVLHDSPAQINDKDSENNDEEGAIGQNTENTQKGEHDGAYPGFIRKIR